MGRRGRSTRANVAGMGALDSSFCPGCGRRSFSADTGEKREPGVAVGNQPGVWQVCRLAADGKDTP